MYVQLHFLMHKHEHTHAHTHTHTHTHSRRFEVQIDVSLPDEGGRREIFEIHTRSMRSEEILASDVDLGLLAGATSRFSGAEIAGVVRAASAYALERYVCVCVFS